MTRRALPLQLRYWLGQDVYGYDRALEDPRAVLQVFLRAGVEQQGQMVQDMVVHQADPKWIALRAYLRRALA